MVGTTAAGPLPAVSLRSGTMGRAASRSSITWSDPGRAVVYVSLASGRSCIVPLDWRPPAGGDRDLGLLQARLEDDPDDPVGGVQPVINTGIAHREAGIGQIGAGIARAPLACFAFALMELGRRLKVSA